MTADQILAAIEAHGLAIRQIPRQVPRLSDLRYHKEGNEIVLYELSLGADGYAKRKVWLQKHVLSPEDYYVFDDVAQTIHRKYTKEVKVPEHAGWWMCQPSRHTDTNMAWRKKAHNLAPTLAESIQLFRDSLPKAGATHPLDSR